MYAEFFRESRSPRLNNLTYASSNMMASMMYPKSSIFDSLNHQKRNPQHLQQHQPPKQQPKQLYIDYPLPNSQPTPKPLPQHSPPPLKTHKKTNSQLSSYGTSSLKNLPRLLSDRDIYQLQAKNFNIISLDPLEKVSNKRKDSIRRDFDEKGYNGISTKQQNMWSQRNNKFIERPYYLNNADEIYF